MTFFRKYYGAEAAVSPYTAAAAAIPEIINLFRGAAMTREGKEMARRNVRPVLNETSDYEDMLQFFQKQAMYGLDPSSMAWQLDQSNRGLTRSLNSVLQGGGDPNLAAGMYGAYTTDIGRIAASDSELRWTKAQQVAQAMQQLYNAKQTDFLYNKDAPYKDTAQLAAAKQQAGFATTSGALDALAGVGVSAMNSNYKPAATVTGNNEVVTTTPTITPGQPFVPAPRTPNFNLNSQWQQYYNAPPPPQLPTWNSENWNWTRPR